jgi:YesN/AraC family two-component response regulator
MSAPRRTPPFRDADSRAQGTERAQKKAADTDPGSAPPTAEAPDGPATDEPAVQRDGSDAEDGTGRPTVLVVEDNARLRRFLRHLLEPEYHVLEAKNGREGLLRARRSMPSLIVSDVRMPEVDGLTMVERLRRSPRTRHIPMMVLTVRSRVEDRREGLERGAVAYLTKPFDVEVLIAQIRSLISNRQQLRARFHEDWTAETSETSEREGPSSFEDRVRSTVRRHLANPDFTVEQLADEIGLARRTVTRKTKEHLGQTPSQFIRTMRVERGARLLAETTETVSQIAYAVGFNSLSYFSRSFRTHFGVPPSIYREEET